MMQEVIDQLIAIETGGEGLKRSFLGQGGEGQD